MADGNEKVADLEKEAVLQDAPLTVLEYTMNKGGTLNFTSPILSLSPLGTRLHWE